MKTHFVTSFALATIVCFLASSPVLAEVPAAEAKTMLKEIATVDESATSHATATQAAQVVSTLPSEQIDLVLNAFAGATKRGKNWLRSIGGDVAENGDFPKGQLQAFYDDRGNDPDARYLAFQLLVSSGADPEQLLSQAETDPSLPIRFLRIQSMLETAKIASMTDNRPTAVAIYQSVVENGRSPAQLKKAVDALADLDVTVELAESLALIRVWKIIGPFDNTDSKDFDTAYPPEQRYLTDGNPIAKTDSEPQEEKGKDGAIEWQTVTSESEMGKVDLNPALSNAKDSVCYAFAEVEIDPKRSGPALAKLGCITANKVWVNGQLILSNNVYHSGTRIDQYVGECELQPGKNTVLIKVLQNAQTEPWAQDWEFQFRFTDPNGAAIPAKL